MRLVVDFDPETKRGTATVDGNEVWPVADVSFSVGCDPLVNYKAMLDSWVKAAETGNDMRLWRPSSAGVRSLRLSAVMPAGGEDMDTGRTIADLATAMRALGHELQQVTEYITRLPEASE
jgi:hypothetical protein